MWIESGNRCTLITCGGVVCRGSRGEFWSHQLLKFVYTYYVFLYSRASNSGSTEKGTLFVRPLYKGHCFRSQNVTFPIVSIHWEPPRRDDLSTRDKPAEFILSPKYLLFKALYILYMETIGNYFGTQAVSLVERSWMCIDNRCTLISVVGEEVEVNVEVTSFII